MTEYAEDHHVTKYWSGVMQDLKLRDQRANTLEDIRKIINTRISEMRPNWQDLGFNNPVGKDDIDGIFLEISELIENTGQ